MKNKSVLRLTQLALMCALSVVIGLVRFPIIPAATFLEFDFADTPILVASLMFGTVPGLAALLVVSLIQAFLLGGNGLIGFIMHFAASGVLVLAVSLIAGRKVRECRAGRVVAALVCGTLAMTAVMIPMNYIFIPILFGAPREAVTQLLVPAIVPFNLIKAGVNSVLAYFVYRALLRIPLLNDALS